MALIPFPNVPKLPGVPSLPRSPKVPTLARAGLGIVQGALWRIFQVDTQWGIFDSKGVALGDPLGLGGIVGGALEAAGLASTLSTNAVDYTKETKVSDFPLEQGSFASYNKVEAAAAPVVTLCFTGSESDRRTFLEAIDVAVKSTELYSVVTPEATYIDYSVERYNYSRRSSKGATLLLVEISLREIRQVSSQYAQSGNGQIDQPKDAGAAPVSDNGKVQAPTSDTSTLKAIANKIPELANRAGEYLRGIF
jgi:hypothetical protein